MKRKLAATIIAVIVSIPLISLVEKGVAHLTGTDGPIIFPSPSWKVIAEHDPQFKDLAGDNVFNFTTVNIAKGVTVKSYSGYLNGPVYFLAQGAVTIDGTIDLSNAPGHSETNLYCYRARYYGSGGARFISEDPIGLNGGSNLYRYAEASTINLVKDDPFGCTRDLASIFSNSFSTSYRFANIKPINFGFQVEKPFVISGTTDAHVQSTYNRANRRGLIESSPNAVEQIGQYSTYTSVSHYSGPDIDKAVGRGWYVVDLPQSKITGDVRVQLEFVSREGDKERYKLIQADERSGPNVAWIYFDQPGRLAISANVIGSPPKLRDTGLADLLAKSRDIGFAKVELTVFLLCEMLPLIAWILTVCIIEFITEWAIGKLPRLIKGRARHQIEMMLTFAKWAGIVCYLIWTAKDILAGIVPAK